LGQPLMATTSRRHNDRGMNKQQAWQPPPPPPPPPPPYTPPPSYSSPPPYSQPPSSGQPRPRLRRSTTDRRIAGVAGGLGEYLGVDATALRVGFVIASILFLGGLGGPVLYVIAWILVPEEGKDAPVTRAAFSGRVWHDWDRSARSWALVLGALALALIWSFGLWPWWHWRTLPVWLFGLALTLWILARHRESHLGLGGPSGTGSPPGPGGPVAPPGGSPMPPQPAPFVPTEDPDRARPNSPVTDSPVTDSPVTPAAPYEPAPYEADPPPAAATAPPANGRGPTSFGVAPGSALADQPAALGHTAGAPEAITTLAAAGPAGAGGSAAPAIGPVAPTNAYPSPAGATGTLVTTSVGSFSPASRFGPRDPSDQAEADWAEAKTAAAYWAADQLARAGVPAPAGAGPAAAGGTGTLTAGQTAVRRLRRAVRILVALIAALLLLGVMTAVGVTLGSGSSLSGGAGNNTYVPLNASSVQPHYRLGAGDLNVNLSQVQFPESGQAVDVTLGVGNVTIEVPKGAVVDVHARSGIGQVDVFGQSGSNVQATSYQGAGQRSDAPHLNVDAHVGLGNLQVTQG
jgi:phage shock protein PspC (stress-responsive transcriptional regulator)